MIARLRRLERVRARQLDHARADHVRASAEHERSAQDRRAAIAGLDAQIGRTVTLDDLENAYASIAQSEQQLARAHTVQERMRERTATAGKAWNRAEQALVRARAERDASKRRDEQREHDELASRRSK